MSQRWASLSVRCAARLVTSLTLLGLITTSASAQPLLEQRRSGEPAQRPTPKGAQELPDEERAHLLNLKSLSGIGVGSTLTGARGLSFYKGLTPLLWSELMVGGRLTQPTAQATELVGSVGLGLHFQLAQAGAQSALSLGLRYVANMGSVCTGDESACASGALATTTLLEHRAELPLRLSYMLNSYLMLHAELGAALLLGSGEPSLIGDAPQEGLSIELFERSSLGVTLWL